MCHSCPTVYGMAGIDLATAEARLQIWLDADTKVAAGQSYEYQGRVFTRVHAAEIRSNLEYWDTKCRQLAGRGNAIRVRQVVPL